MPIESLICFIGCAGILLFQLVFKRNYLGPGAMYLLVIGGTLGISLLGIMPAMTPLQPLTWFVLGISSLAFLVGLSSSRFFFLSQNIRLPHSHINTPALQGAFDRYDWNKHLFWLLGLVGLYGIALIRFLYKYKVPSVFSSQLTDIVGKKGMEIGYLYLPIILYPLLLMLLIPCLSRLTRFSLMKRILLWGVFGVLLVTGVMFWPARGAMMHFLIFAIVFVNTVVKRISLVHLFIFILVGMGAFWAVASVKKQVERINFSDSKLWTLPYSYIANNYWNLDYAINPPSEEELHPHTFGHQTLGGFLGLEFWPDWLPIRLAFQWESTFNERVEKVGGLNTHGYWWRLYKDFWIWGVAIFPFLGGIWQGWLYNRVRFRPDIPHLMIYSFLNIFIVMSFFSDFWGMGTTPLYLLGLWTVSKNCAATSQKGFVCM